jgi:predicted ATPase
MENLHWIDTATQAFLDSLLDSLPSARILLLVNYRPDYVSRWETKPAYTQLRLDPLTPTSALEFLCALVGDDAALEPLRQRLIEWTAGNPFFLEESVRNLVETGVLVGEPGAYRLTQTLQTIHIPLTVQAVLMGRIDRLPPAQKRLLQAAAVIGRMSRSPYYTPSPGGRQKGCRKTSCPCRRRNFSTRCVCSLSVNIPSSMR